MTLLKKIIVDRRFHRVMGVGILLGSGLLLLLWRLGYGLSDLKAGWQATEMFLQTRPWWLFLGLVILPGLPVPTSALMFLAGTVWRDQPVVACGICLLAMALNMSWTYWAAAKPGRGLLQKLLAAGSLRIPDLPAGNDLRFILLLRLTPGIPLFLQNYLLGFLQVPFFLYLPVSLACSGLIACGIVLSGAGVAGGNLTPMIAGLGLIVVGFVVVQMVRKRLRG